MLLAIIAQVSALHGGDGAPRDVVCLRAKYTGKPQGFSKAISRLIQSDHLRSVKGGLLVLTQKGSDAAVDVEPPAETNDDQIKEEREQLSGSQLTIFDLLLEAPSDARLERSVLMEKIGSKTKGGFDKMLSRMRTTGCIDTDKECAWLSDRVFPFGRPN